MKHLQGQGGGGDGDDDDGANYLQFVHRHGDLWAQRERALGTANGGARRGRHVEEPQRFADVGSIGPGCMLPLQKRFVVVNSGIEYHTDGNIQDEQCD